MQFDAAQNLCRNGECSAPNTHEFSAFSHRFLDSRDNESVWGINLIEIYYLF